MDNRFDRLVKDVAREGLGLVGTVSTQKKIVAGAQHADVSYEPDPKRAHMRRRLGLLGRVAVTPCIIEAYSDTPRDDELRACLHKHLAAWRSRPAAKKPTKAAEPPMLWVLTTGRPAFAFQSGFLRRAAAFPRGVYAGPDFLRVRVVVLSELPRGRSTLLVRLMGGKRVLLQATEELLALPEGAPEREIAHHPVLRLFRQIAADPSPRTPEEKEFLMRAQNIVQEYIEEGRKQGLAQGVAQGVAQGLAQGMMDLYDARFGAMPAPMRSKVEATADDALLRRWILVVGTGSAEDVARAISGTPRAAKSSARRVTTTAKRTRPAKAASIGSSKT